MMLGDRSVDLRTKWLGRLAYEEGLRLQEEQVGLRRDGGSEDLLFLLEHEPVYTIGRTRDRSSLGGSDPASLPHPFHEINRGGQSTYHGPGQLVGYPIIDLHAYGRDLHAYLRALEESLTNALSDCGIPARRREGLTGVWVDGRKIASIGVGVRGWVTMHGFALNVDGDLGPFNAIVPCGIENVVMTSMAQEWPADTKGRSPGVEEFARRYPPFLSQSLRRLMDGATVEQRPTIKGNKP